MRMVDREGTRCLVHALDRRLVAHMTHYRDRLISFSMRLSRRRLLGASAGSALFLAACGNSVGKPVAGEPTVISPHGTPAIEVAGYLDPSKWQGKTLKVATFVADIQGALGTSVFAPFSAATGCTIAQFQTDYAALVDSVQRGEPYADVLLVDSVWAADVEAPTYVEPLPSETVTSSRFAPIAPTNIMVPAYTYALISAFRYDAVLRIGEPQSWQEWWDTERYTGARAMQRGALGNFEFAMMATGVTPDQLYPLDSAGAVESLKQVSGKIVDRWWDSAEQPVEWLATAKTDFTPAWHFRVQSGQDGKRQFDMTWNQGLVLHDVWVVGKGTDQLDIAADFIRYATSAEAQASLAATLRLGPVTPDALDLLEPDLLSLLPTSSQNLARLVLLDTNWWAANNVEANERFNSWLLGVPFHG